MTLENDDNADTLVLTKTTHHSPAASTRAVEVNDVSVASAVHQSGSERPDEVIMTEITRGSPGSAHQAIAKVGASSTKNADGLTLTRTSHHSPTQTSQMTAEVGADGTVRRSDAAAHADSEAAKQPEAIRVAHQEGKPHKGKRVEKGAIRLDKQVQNGEANDVPSEDPWLFYVDLFRTWVILAILLLLFMSFRKSKVSKGPKWQKVNLVDSFLSRQFALRREVARTEGWDSHFPQKDIPSSLCSSICYMERAPSRQWLEQQLTTLVQKAPRFGAVFKENLQALEPVAKLDLNYHIVEHGETSSKRARDELMQALLHKEAELDMNKPLWRLYILPCKEDDVCLIFSFSRAIGDAVSIMSTLLLLMGADKDGKGFDLINSNLRRALQARMPAKCLAYCYKILSFFKAIPYVWEAVTPSSWAAETSLPCHNPERFWDTPFSGPLSLTPANQHLLNFPLVPVKYIRDLKNKAKAKEGFEHCTVNDVLFSVYLGTLRRYCDDVATSILEPDRVVKDLIMRGCRIHNSEALMTIANGQEVKVGDTSEFFIGELGDAMGEATADQRLKQVVQTFDKVKKSGRPHATKLASKFIPHMLKDPKDMVAVLAQLHKKVTFCFSGMCLPDELVYFEGIQVKQIRSVYHDNVPTVVSVSYGDNVAMGVNICKPALKGWERMPGFFIDELNALGHSLGVKTAQM
eukprot:gnl/MRDRNA2_/MRDRNA2_110967_c0_seq1.p1 gnl/MRDRNA2_/MRDRNA2_110967_c0~~gnl/MRDRNA2_/MRDRNA2_110967_c0_seq1.p1  ORF type:complete len:794 (+),score=147.70 gnl/MRDRNA2_/MRDRNA2_110967_c0_seq1:313-2382(+)